jgi:hypothetical protein
LQRCGQIRARRYIVTCLAQRIEHRFRAGQSVQPHGMGHLIRAARIGGEEEGDAAFPGGRGVQMVPCRNLVRDRRDAFSMGAVQRAGILQIGVDLAR